MFRPVARRSVAQCVAIGIWRAVHPNLAVLVAGVGRIDLVPLEAGRHRQEISQRDAIFLGRAQIRILRKERHHALINAFDPAAIDSYPDNQVGNALGHRALVMPRLGSEYDLADLATEALIGAGEIVLEHQFAVARDQNGVYVSLFPISEPFHHRTERRAGDADALG